MRFFAVAAVSAATSVTPVQKVVQLLNGMMEKGKQEKHSEQVQFSAYKQWCDDTITDKKRAIAEANREIEKLKADIQKNRADAAQLGREIDGHNEDISVWEGDKKAATSVREIENTDYIATHKDYSESIDALGRAINVLKQQNFDRKQASEALVQVRALAGIARDQTAAIDTFLAQVEQDPLDVSAPDAHGYEFQSGGVIEMLEKLLDKFEDERDTLRKEETNSKHSFELLIQDLTAQVTTATEARDEKSQAKAKKLQRAAVAKGDLTDTTSSRDADSKYLGDTTATCEQKASDFGNRQQLRAEEIEAIEKAMEILSSDDVSGAAEKHLPSLAQMSFAQLRATTSDKDRQSRAVDFLRNEGSRLNSRVLAALSVRASEDPFTKVKKMIKDLIVRLMEEANEEAEHKGWCDTELATNEQTRKAKTEQVELLHAECDELEASIAKRGEDITNLTKAVAELDHAVAEATELREEEKAENTATVADAKDAQAAVAQALEVLRSFYAKAGEATSLVQQSPEIFDSPYQGMQAENGGVVGMIEVIQSDFARLEAETSASEAQAHKEYDEFMTDSAVDKAAKQKDIEHKTAKKQNQSQALTEKKSDLEGTQKELNAALEYYDKLKPSCIDAGVSYEDRVARREEEVQSLQEALKILSGEDIA